MSRVVLIPGVLALLPEYASIDDPVAGLRAAVLDAVACLEGPVKVLADAQGSRVAGWALSVVEPGGRPRPTVSKPPQPGRERKSARLRWGEPDSGFDTLASLAAQPPSWLVVGNGSARRTTEAPGYFDERAAAFDEELGRRLREGVELDAVDVALARELWASVEGIVAMSRIPDLGPAEVLYDDDPFGVQYWVMRWPCGR